ncbi:hypothetical protein [Nocardia xishanensis]|uniref:Uncharacterized protein n=1 Tax=Nocardia xishanensis TaxID=238964 RepID=A0ABW7XBV6_9NOCA
MGEDLCEAVFSLCPAKAPGIAMPNSRSTHVSIAPRDPIDHRPSVAAPTTATHSSAAIEIGWPAVQPSARSTERSLTRPGASTDLVAQTISSKGVAATVGGNSNRTDAICVT